MGNIKPKVWPIVLVVGLSVILISGAFYWYLKAQASGAVLAQGGVQTTMAVAADGLHDDIIVVTTPTINTLVKSPLLIEGKARGTWFFEGSFPISIIDAEGKTLGNYFGEALSDWMTEEFVPFRAHLTFSAPTTERGTLILHNDNPSGLPENNDEIRIPVRFEKSLTVTIMVPSDEALYRKEMTEYTQGGGDNPLTSTKFVTKEIVVPFTTDTLKASAQAAAAEIPHGGGGTGKALVSYMKVQDSTAYVLLDIDLDGWAGVAVSRAIIHPLVEKTLWQFSEISRVEFRKAPALTAAMVPIDKSFRITNIGNARELGQAVMSVFPIYAYACETYIDSSGTIQKYSKIDFFAAKDEKKSATILLGSTLSGSAGSGECDLALSESKLKTSLAFGKYKIWAVRFIGNKTDKRTLEVKVEVVKVAVAE